MKSRPILFNTPMVRALLDGTKTQTRRAMKPQMVYGNVCGLFNSWYLPKGKDGGTLWPNAKEQILATCPYGQVGDQLWVRESFDFLPAGGPDQPQACQIVYWATGTTEPRDAPIDYNPMIYAHEKVRPSIHMPRFASRITLEITSVRVERLQDITRGDCMAEGCPFPNIAKETDPKGWYSDLWTSINGADSWGKNPWVWVIEFKKVTA